MSIKKDFKIITKHYNNLINIINNNYFVGITNEWIVDNYYLIAEQYKKLINFKRNKKIYKYVNKNVDMFKIINNILLNHNYLVSPKTIMKELDSYQNETGYNFRYKELLIVPTLMEIILINKIAEICSSEGSCLLEKKLIDKALVKLKIALLNYEQINLNDYINIKKISNSGIFYLSTQVKKLDENANLILKQLNDFLKKENLTLRYIINEEYKYNTQINIIIQNVFKSISYASMIEVEQLYEKLNDIERILVKDKDYSKMTLETKEIFRSYLVEKAKSGNVAFLDFLNNALKENKKLTDYIETKKTNDLKAKVYIAIVVISTILISYIISPYLGNYRWYSFFILLIPLSELVITFVKRVFLEFHKTEIIPKLDFSNGIPNSYKTMVVIPTIIKDDARIREVFANLEKYYLANKSKNLYFALLGDCCQHNKEDHPNDQLVVETGYEVVKKLNEKYGKNTFNFVFRRRKYNAGENCFLGFERKRGALLHFNDLILGNLSPEEKNEYFKGHTFNNFHYKIKYVITLDVDTGLGIGAIWKLVGAMAHPLNKPILNKENNKVIKGYGILQPRIGMDIESTNASLFSKLYAGVGGFDPYNYVYPSFYQDVFKEGSFCGKGIYDLEITQKVLKDRFPNNLILSHDLLEGNYLRCGDVVDVEFIDDFPAQFLVDANRRSRWARGDMQIISWIFPKVKNKLGQTEKNPLSIIGRWKIFDNIRRGFIDFFSVLIIIIALTNTVINPLWWLLFITIIYLTPIMNQVFETIFIFRNSFPTFKHYNILIIGYKAVILRAVTSFVSVSYNAYLYLNSFSRSLYRMLISKKNLLNWVTADEAARVVKTNVVSTLKQFWLNYIFALFLIIYNILFSNFNSANMLVLLLLTFGPFIIYLISKPIKLKEYNLSLEEKESLKDLAFKTWLFFKDNIREEVNYLIPDNYQLNRDIKEDIKTSPTNIGLSLVSIISAYEMKFISLNEATNLIGNIIKTIEKLDKWHGHLFNWYNIKTLDIMPPHFISSIDSGNFVASLMVVRSFLKKKNKLDLMKRVNKLIIKTDFKCLFTKQDVFSIGYNVDKGSLEPFNYNKFMSESRIMSYVAIAKGDIPLKHWFCLDKTLITYKRQKGLSSWGGTAFEYFMPLIFMRNYPNTLLDESYHFAFFVGKDFMKNINSKYPFGISESAYNELDDGKNYKYQAFGIPQLKLKDEPLNRIVVSPYCSILALSLFPKEVINNIARFKKYNMIGDYGLFESYDFFDKTSVRAYYAHHQGMILSSFCNYLSNSAIQNYFNEDINNQAFNFLNKEKIQIKPSIDYKIMKYKKYTYEKEPFINDVRVYNYLSSLPQLSVLSNSKYSVIINDLGIGYSKYREIVLNRHRKVTEQDYGLFLYIKDLEDKRVWSNTYAPSNVKPNKYEIVFALDKVKFTRTDRDVITTTEIVVTRSHNAEIRKITFKNNSNRDKHLELTTYTETILSFRGADISHPAFNNLFVESEYDQDTNSVIMSRKSRTSDSRYYMINRLLIKEPLEKYQYETNRLNFLGRGYSLKKPKAINQNLKNHVGTTLDPIISLRNKIKVPKNSETTVYLISGFGKSKKQVIDIVKAYNNEKIIKEQGFDTSTIMTNITTKALNITANDMRLYNILLNYLLQTRYIEINDERYNLINKNILNQTNLWRFNISGNYPMILLDAYELDNLSLVKELLMAFEYYKSKSIFIDLIIINSEKREVAKIINKEIENEKYRMNALNSFGKLPGNIYIINRNDLSKDEYALFKTVSRLVIDSSYFNSLDEYITELQKLNLVAKGKPKKEITMKKSNYDITKLKLYNGYGGFENSGREYVIVNQNTPHSWSNVISNKNFGTIITNDNCGFTYFKNSQEYKLTSWTNDTVLKDASEGFRINDIKLNFNLVKHGFGYSEFQGDFKRIKISLTQFVAKEASIKFYKMKLNNTSSRKQRIVLTFWINPVLGFTEEKTSRYILTEFNETNNYLKMRNTYDKNYNNIYTFLSSNYKITNAVTNNLLFKEIEIDFYIDGKTEQEVIFTLGTNTIDNLDKFIKTYTNEESANLELKLVKENWGKQLTKIQVETPDDSFNYLVNGWLLYQTISSRIQARAGYYQVGGAFGYRDQLQDAMNICIVDSTKTKEQIIINAKHQFIEGDVLHWWHPTTKLGLRSLYKDDYLWLIYATSEYINITEDLSILKEQIPFVLGDKLKENQNETVIEFTYSENKAHLYEHCKIALHKAMNELGENGLPLIGGGDWNDGMNMVGIKGKGTSVWLGFFLYMMVERFIDITKKYDSKINIDKYLKFNQKLKKSLQIESWDGEYYKRAFFDSKNPIGSVQSAEAKIDLISQSFAILSNVAKEKQIEQIIKSVEDKLVDKKHKIIKLLDPPFKNNKEYPGYIMDYPKGIRENGGQYTHSVAWYIMALLKVGLNDLAYNYYQMINPIERTKVKTDASKYCVEPYVITADIYSNKQFLGKGGWSWYTGSSAWFYKVALTDIIGLKLRGKKLYINPKVPSTWSKFIINYKYKDSTYKIKVLLNKKETKITIDNKLIKTNYIELKDNKKTYEVVVEMGESHAEI